MKWLALICHLLLLSALVSMSAPTLVEALSAPSIQVVPTPVGRGQVATVYGRDFCGSPGCSSVTIAVDESTLTMEVQVGADGTFSFPFVATQVPNQYRVTARQTSADGSLLEATYGLLILGSDQPPGQTPAPAQTLSPTAGTTPSSTEAAGTPTVTPKQSLLPSGTALTNATASGSPAAGPVSAGGSDLALLVLGAVGGTLALLAGATFIWLRYRRGID